MDPNIDDANHIISSSTEKEEAQSDDKQKGLNDQILQKRIPQRPPMKKSLGCRDHEDFLHYSTKEERAKSPVSEERKKTRLVKEGSTWVSRKKTNKRVGGGIDQSPAPKREGIETREPSPLIFHTSEEKT